MRDIYTGDVYRNGKENRLARLGSELNNLPIEELFIKLDEAIEQKDRTQALKAAIEVKGYCHKCRKEFNPSGNCSCERASYAGYFADSSK